MSVDRIKMSIEFDSFPFTTLLQAKNSNINRGLTCFYPFLSITKNSKQKKKKIQLMKNFSAAPIICELTNH